MMTKTLTSVHVTGIASVIMPGTILLPKGTPPISPVVVEASDGTTKLLPGGVRADSGTAAALPGDILTKMGGVDSVVRYRAGTWRDILHYKPVIWLQLLITVLTLVATVFAAISAYVGTRSPTTPAFTAEAAPWVLVVAFVLAFSKLVSDVRTALG
jgi:hypothetical protein